MNKKELFDTMREIVDGNVESYKSDFEIDKESINEWENEKWWGVWLVRNHGTQLKRFTNAIMPMEYIDAVYGNMRVKRAYFISFERDGYHIEEVKDRNEIKEKYDLLTEYQIEVFVTENYSYLLRGVNGCFDSDEKARECGEQLMKDNGGKSVRITEKSRYF